MEVYSLTSKHYKEYIYITLYYTFNSTEFISPLILLGTLQIETLNINNK